LGDFKEFDFLKRAIVEDAKDRKRLLETGGGVGCPEVGDQYPVVAGVWLLASKHMVTCGFVEFVR